MQKTSENYIQLCPGAADTPIWTIGSASGNVGVFALAILQQPSKTLPGKFVCAWVEKTTNGRMLQDWADVVGKTAVYVQTSPDDYDNVWPGIGRELALMMKLWDDLGQRSWTGEDGILDKDDLGLAAMDFVGFKRTIKEMDWDALL